MELIQAYCMATQDNRRKTVEAFCKKSLDQVVLNRSSVFLPPRRSGKSLMMYEIAKEYIESSPNLERTPRESYEDIFTIFARGINKRFYEQIMKGYTGEFKNIPINVD